MIEQHKLRQNFINYDTRNSFFFLMTILRRVIMDKVGIELGCGLVVVVGGLWLAWVVVPG